MEGRARRWSTRASRWRRSSARASARSSSRAAQPNRTTSPSRAWRARAAAEPAAVVTLATEHRAVLDPCRTLERERVRVTVPWRRPRWPGRSRPAARRRDGRHAARQRDGGQQRDRRAAAARRDRGIANAHGALFHCDAVQAAGLSPPRRDASWTSISSR